LHELIMKLPEKYETQVGERGLKLSGGEKQRVAIARLLLKNAPIHMYDEPTSSLDITTEQKIIQHLENIEIPNGKHNKTTSIIIAHRLSTIMNADKIIVLGTADMNINGKLGDYTGQVVEKGTHLELVNKNGVYADMWRRQQHKQNK
jgi:ABC-type transport system involved in Fe-S cluster assembly fused permease/ATPase subunit